MQSNPGAAVGGHDVWDYPALFLAGFLIALAQYFLLQEVTALSSGTEVVVLLVTIAYFTGFSLGYKIAGKVSDRAVKRLTALFFVMSLTFPFSLRIVAGALAEILPGLALLALLFLAAFVFVSYFSMLLPVYIDKRGGASLPNLYAVELCGTAFGFAAVFMVGAAPAWVMSIIYHLAFGLLAVAVLRQKVAAAMVAAMVAISAFLAPYSDAASLAYFYSRAKWLDVSQTMYSVYSPYQKVDIFKTEDGKRYLYLNGILFFGSGSLSLFNLFLTRLPVDAAKPKNVLVLGSGSMQYISYAAKHSEKVTTVELDGAVLRGSMEHFADLNMARDTPNWRYFVDDGKKFLAASNEKFDLIALDIPAPFTIQTGLMYSEDFMRLAKEKLTPNGVFSISLCGKIESGGLIANAVAAGVLNTFGDVIIHTPDKSPYSFAIAGEKLPFTKEDVERLSASYNAPSATYNKEQALAMIKDTKPMRWDNPSLPVKASFQQTKKKFVPRGSR